MSLTRVRDLMTSEIFTIDADQDFISVSDMMKLKYVRHLPVVRAGKLVGLVTQRDLIRAQAKLALELLKEKNETDEKRVVSVRVSDFMSTGPLLTCTSATPADDAARLMLDRKIGCVLVVENDVLVGILTESDLMKWSIEMMAKLRLEQAGKPLAESGSSGF